MRGAAARWACGVRVAIIPLDLLGNVECLLSHDSNDKHRSPSLSDSTVEDVSEGQDEEVKALVSHQRATNKMITDKYFKGD